MSCYGCESLDCLDCPVMNPCVFCHYYDSDKDKCKLKVKNPWKCEKNGRDKKEETDG